MKDKEYYSIKKMIEYCDKCKKYTDGYSNRRYLRIKGKSREYFEEWKIEERKW